MGLGSVDDRLHCARKTRIAKYGNANNILSLFNSCTSEPSKGMFPNCLALFVGTFSPPCACLVVNSKYQSRSDVDSSSFRSEVSSDRTKGPELVIAISSYSS